MRLRFGWWWWWWLMMPTFFTHYEKLRRLTVNHRRSEAKVKIYRGYMLVYMHVISSIGLDLGRRKVTVLSWVLKVLFSTRTCIHSFICWISMPRPFRFKVNHVGQHSKCPLLWPASTLHTLYLAHLGPYVNTPKFWHPSEWDQLDWNPKNQLSSTIVELRAMDHGIMIF